MPIFKTMVPYPIMPVPNEYTQPYWDGTREAKLMIQRCQKCGYYNHPPLYICINCKDRDAPLAWEQVSGRGTIYTHYICHDNSIAGFEKKVPYPVVIVELEEQKGLFFMSNLLNLEYDAYGSQIKPGMPVEAVFEKASDTITVVQFQPSPQRRGRRRSPTA